MSTPTTPSDRAREAAGMVPAGRQLSIIEKAQKDRIAGVERWLPRFLLALQNDQAKADRFKADAINCLRDVPKLALATELSFLGSLMTAAQLDLRPNVGAIGHCWVLPFENKRAGTVEAQFILGYRGMITLAARSGVTVTAQTVYERDHLDLAFGLNERLDHRPPTDPGSRLPILDPSERGRPIAHYAVLRTSTGGITWRIISHAEALAARDASPGYKFGGPDNPWRKDGDNGWPMCRKTVVRRTFPFVPTDSPQLAMGFAADDRVVTYDESTGETSFTDADMGLTVLRADIEAEAAEPPAEPAKKAPAKKATAKKVPPKPRPQMSTAHLPEDGPSEEDIAAMRAEAQAQQAEFDQATAPPADPDFTS